MARLHVRTFARYAELLGDPILVDVNLPTTAAGLVEALRLLPGGDLLPTHLLLAADHRALSPTDLIQGVEELALLPPFAGG